MPASRRALPFVACLAWAATAVVAGDPAPSRTCPQDFASVVLSKGGVDLCARIIRETSRGTYEAEGDVTLRAQDVRLQAARLAVADERRVTAEGDVLVAWRGNRISGARMTYDLEAGVGDVEDAVGQVVSDESELFFSAKQAKKVGADRVNLKSATVTTCTQPVPHWSFSVSSAKVRLDHYARMWNVRLRAKKVPVFYLPFLVWPVKSDRSAGLLFPTFGSTRDRGSVVSESVFIPLGRSADLMLAGEYYTKGGWGGGLRFRARPNLRGEIQASGSYIYDTLAEERYPGGEITANRWRYTYKQTQDFQNGFRLVADVNEVSDAQYFSDFERELQLVSSPAVLTRVEMSRSGAWTSINVRELRRKQFFGSDPSDTLVQETLPEIEWTGRSHRIGRSPLYFAFSSSLASIRQRSAALSADYYRGDFFPTLSIPWSPRPWIDIIPSVGARATYWTQSLSPDDATVVESDGISRRLLGGSVEFVGPKIFRIFERPDSGFSPRYKHTFETRVAYQYQQAYDRSGEIIRFDEIDSSIGSVNQMTYGFRTRLFAQRPRSAPSAATVAAAAVLLPGETAPVTAGTSGEETGAPPTPAPAAEVREPVEIASFEVRQSRSFNRLLVCRDLNGTDDVPCDAGQSRSSPIEATGRFSPSQQTGFDLRAQYDTVAQKVAGVSLSGNIVVNAPETGVPAPGSIREELARLRLSIVHKAALTPNELDSTQVIFGSHFQLWNTKLRFGFDGTWNPTAPVGESNLPVQAWRLEYWTQCCGFVFTYLSRDYSLTLRKEFHFTVNLRGIGNLLNPQWSTQESYGP